MYCVEIFFVKVDFVVDLIDFMLLRFVLVLLLELICVISDCRGLNFCEVIVFQYYGNMIIEELVKDFDVFGVGELYWCRSFGCLEF